MDASTIQELLMPITYGRHPARRFPIGRLLAGTGLTEADLRNRDRCITVAQAPQYIRNTLDLAAARVDLGYPAPACADRYGRFFRCPVHFDAALSSSVERTSLAEVLHYLGNAYTTRKRSRSQPTADEIARQLHVAPRTLIRHPERLGTSYQTVVDDFLKGRAAELLANDRVLIKEVAAALGFTNPASSGNLFKRWYGVSPGGFRAGRTISTRE